MDLVMGFTIYLFSSGMEEICSEDVGIDFWLWMSECVSGLCVLL